ncbi:MAG: DUF1848 domain-containing protein [Desulfovibrio sp.]|uniref:DUF1848 domain-containing protein n=1 Tax=Desulfovibrio sp. TaxID=885 RepID=UPI001A6A9151|nr:DUF1848 domain-containing protein [Desulfovibrio sp.]MBD5418353.1 DUF1848 domain-containing protein [Desulfovibrio sp.]
MKWTQTVIATPAGPKGAIAPLVISASRATDIPAFHARWFMDRLRAGHCLWQNPFNARQRQYVSFDQCAAIVFWSKDPSPLLPYLAEIEARGYAFYFQYTLNDYEREGLEPHVPSLDRRIATFQELSGRFGKHRVIWRHDPILIGNRLSVAVILERLHRVAELLAPHTEKLVFSFLDMYRKMALRLAKQAPGYRAPDAEEMNELAEGIARMNVGLQTPLRLATCAETVDLLHLGIEHNRCIDPALLLRLCPENAELARICGATARKEQGSLLQEVPAGLAPVKDRGQRAACGCAPSKDIGRYNTCPHLCVYCYANGSQAEVERGLRAARGESESR